MRSMFMVGLMALAVGCGGSKASEPGAEQASQDQAQAKQSPRARKGGKARSNPKAGGAKGKKAPAQGRKQGAGAKKGAAGAKGKGKGKGGAKGAGAKANAGTPAAAAQAAAVSYGATGDVPTTLALVGSGEGAATRTKATLTFQSTAGEQVASLGEINGTCIEAEPTTMGDAGVTPLWVVSCDGPKMDAELAISQKDGALYVHKARIVDGTKSPYRVVKQLKLADGAQVMK